MAHHRVVASTGDWYREQRNWYGSYLEVAIDLGPSDDQRLMAAFRAAWASPLLEGPLESPTGKAAPAIGSGYLGPSSYGKMRLPDGNTLGCIVMSVRDDESDWLDVSIPTGMLEAVYKIEYPLSHDGNGWLGDIEGGLLSIAVLVNETVPFDLATIGDEASGMYYADSRKPERAVTSEIIDRGGGFPPIAQTLGPPGSEGRCRGSAGRPSLGPAVLVKVVFCGFPNVGSGPAPGPIASPGPPRLRPGSHPGVPPPRAPCLGGPPPRGRGRRPPGRPSADRPGHSGGGRRGLIRPALTGSFQDLAERGSPSIALPWADGFVRNAALWAHAGSPPSSDPAAGGGH